MTILGLSKILFKGQKIVIIGIQKDELYYDDIKKAWMKTYNNDTKEMFEGNIEDIPLKYLYKEIVGVVSFASDKLGVIVIIDGESEVNSNV